MLVETVGHRKVSTGQRIHLISVTVGCGLSPSGRHVDDGDSLTVFVFVDTGLFRVESGNIVAAYDGFHIRQFVQTCLMFGDVEHVGDRDGIVRTGYHVGDDVAINGTLSVPVVWYVCDFDVLGGFRETPCASLVVESVNQFPVSECPDVLELVDVIVSFVIRSRMEDVGERVPTGAGQRVYAVQFPGGRIVVVNFPAVRYAFQTHVGVHWNGDGVGVGERVVESFHGAAVNGQIRFQVPQRIDAVVGSGVVIHERVLDAWRVRILWMGGVRVVVVFGITVEHPTVWGVLISLHVAGGHVVDGESLGDVAVHSLTVQSDCHAVKLFDGMNRAVSPIEPVTIGGGTVGQDVHDGILVGDSIDHASPLHRPIVGHTGQFHSLSRRVIYSVSGRVEAR